MTVEKNTTISGYRRSHGWRQDKTYFFVAEFSRPFDSFGFDVNGKPMPRARQRSKGLVRRPISTSRTPPSRFW